MKLLSIAIFLLPAVVDAEVATQRFDIRFDEIVPQSAELERLTGGHQWVEGPAWDDTTQALLYSDIPANTIYRWRAGTVDTFLAPSGYSGDEPYAGREPGSNGLLFDSSGKLIICQHGDRRIVRLNDDGGLTILADRYLGRRLNSPNDAVLRSNGDLYFTDPPFGLPGTFADPQRELSFSGVYRLSAKGELELLIADLKAPNGIAFSPDEKTLYVTDVDPTQPAWHAYDVTADGGVENGRVFYDAGPWSRSRRGGPDGLKTDIEGNLFAAGPEAVYVFAPDGTLLGLIETGVPTANVAWGEDGSTLFVAADTAIFRIRLTTIGSGTHRGGEQF